MSHHIPSEVIEEDPVRYGAPTDLCPHDIESDRYCVKCEREEEPDK